MTSPGTLQVDSDADVDPLKNEPFESVRGQIPWRTRRIMIKDNRELPDSRLLTEVGLKSAEDAIKQSVDGARPAYRAHHGVKSIVDKSGYPNKPVKVDIMSVDFAMQMTKCVLIGILVVYLIMVIFTFILFIAKCIRFSLRPCVFYYKDIHHDYGGLFNVVNGEMNWLYAVVFPWYDWPKTVTCADHIKKSRKHISAKKARMRRKKSSDGDSGNGGSSGNSDDNNLSDGESANNDDESANNDDEPANNDDESANNDDEYESLLS
jgi:hypothetical protein